MVKVISTPGPKAIYIEKLKLAVLYKLDNHEIFPRLRGLFSSYTKKCQNCAKSKFSDLFTIDGTWIYKFEPQIHVSYKR